VGQYHRSRLGVSQPKLVYTSPYYSYREGRGGSLATVEQFLTLIHWLEPPFLYNGDPNPR